MNARTTGRVVLEVLGWWAGLTLLWQVLISTADTLEWVVGASAALVGALAARATRRAVGDR
ncbi:hypothetical protein AB0N87_11900 [Streptomyces sp. NPDC093228]|jgi:hypothetical protein|uniref:hypothetical protein n=1 Tax=unclassified Streptomyces TaxID=2593676 RepID=UPI000740E0C9|nr:MULTISPECIES: hypothetical protein [unclassified Streptomyces]KUJ38678.1 hypothetical protein ADL25_23110 [Streptomyces sp. NRRL F-5122]MDX3258170.1 hypothetical protein [Streptomyces sp. MI02-2A]REE58428.1 hypothetical protein BX257_0850 [Streptomyces sp. 3212.3]